MAPEKIVSVTSRRPTDEENDIADWFEKQEAESIDHLETAARQIITLVTTFYGLIFGVLALSSDTFAASLRLPWVTGLGIAAVLLLLLALAAALRVVMPRRYSYGEASLDRMQAAYQNILNHKFRWLRRATLLFGLGLTTFAGLIISLLLTRI